jgi:SAM-dependent methyltransferase
MKRYIESNNINTFNGDNGDNGDNENEDSGVRNYYWKPNSLVNKIIENFCITKKLKTNLEIGPGNVPFPLATHFIGSNENVSNYTEIDIDCQPIPFNTDSFDFIYCRHVLEDIQNPDFALKEMGRVSKYGGYIETPSPLIEVTKDVDGTSFTRLYCGYIHHRYIVWSNMEKNEIYFLPKYSCILDNVNSGNKKLFHLINNYPVYWNNYFIFTTPPKIIMYKNGVNFNVGGLTMVDEYLTLVNRAVIESIQNTDYFIKHYKSFLDGIIKE